MKFKHDLGLKYGDKITKFVGVATGRVEYISGCNQYLLAGEAKDGEIGKTIWVDEQRLELVSGYQEAIVLDNSETPGFGESAPVK